MDTILLVYPVGSISASPFRLSAASTSWKGNQKAIPSDVSKPKEYLDCSFEPDQREHKMTLVLSLIFTKRAMDL